MCVCGAGLCGRIGRGRVSAGVLCVRDPVHLRQRTVHQRQVALRPGEGLLRRIRRTGTDSGSQILMNIPEPRFLSFSLFSFIFLY